MGRGLPEAADGDERAEALVAIRSELVAGQEPWPLLIEAFAVVFGRPSARSRRGPRAAAERAMRRCDRWAPDGRRAGAGALVLLDMLVRHAARGEQAPWSLSFFAAPLDRYSKVWRRERKPRRGRPADAAAGRHGEPTKEPGCPA